MTDDVNIRSKNVIEKKKLFIHNLNHGLSMHDL